MVFFVAQLLSTWRSDLFFCRIGSEPVSGSWVETTSSLDKCSRWQIADQQNQWPDLGNVLLFLYLCCQQLCYGRVWIKEDMFDVLVFHSDGIFLQQETFVTKGHRGGWPNWCECGGFLGGRCGGNCWRGGCKGRFKMHIDRIHTVDGRNPANQLRLVVYPLIYKVL